MYGQNFNTYKGRQGTGFATNINLDRTASALEKASAIKAKATADEQKRKNDIWSKLKSTEIPEHWYKYKKQMQGKYEDLMNLGSEILNNNGNPFEGNDDASIMFQKRYNQMTAGAEYSTQLQKKYDEGRKLMQTKGQDEYKNWEEFQNFFDEEGNDLFSLMDNQTQPPVLMKNKALTDIDKYHQAGVDALFGKNHDGPMDENMIQGYIQSTMTNPTTFPELEKSYDARFQMMQPSTFDALKNKASSNGRSIYEQAMYDDVKKHESAVSIESVLDQIAGNIKPDSKSSTIEKGDVTTTSSKTTYTEAQAKAAIREAMLSDPRMTKFAGGANDEDQVNKFYDQFKDQLDNRIKTDSNFKRTTDEGGRYGGMSEKEYKENRGQWYEDLKQGGLQQASDYLVGYELKGEDLTIQKTQIVNGKMQIFLKGDDIEGRKVKDENGVTTGIKGVVGKFDESEQAIVREYDLNALNDQEILFEAYDEAFQKRKKQPYGADYKKEESSFDNLGIEKPANKRRTADDL